jgi:hypothetical protein
MSRIQLSNLTTAGTELFQGSENFLTELKATEAHAIFGGKGGSKKKSSSKKKSGSGSSGYGGGYGCYNPCRPCH